MNEMKGTLMHFSGDAVIIFHLQHGIPDISNEIERKGFCNHLRDSICKFQMRLPRHSFDTLGALLFLDEKKAINVICMDSQNILNIVGTSLMCLGRYCVDHGLVSPVTSPFTHFKVQCSDLKLDFKVQVQNNISSLSVISGIPSYVYEKALEINIETGPVRVNILFGGYYFISVDVKEVNLDFEESSIRDFMKISRNILMGVEEQKLRLCMPQSFRITYVMGVLFTGGDDDPKHMMHFWSGQYSRSASPVGVTGRMAYLYFEKKVKLNEDRVFYGLMNVPLTGRVINEYELSNRRVVTVQIEGCSHYLNFSNYVSELGDPLRVGYRVHPCFFPDEVGWKVRELRPMLSIHSDSLDDLCAEFWSWRLQEWPEFATSIGVHDYDDRLDSYSEETLQKRYEAAQSFLKRAKLMMPTLNLLRDKYVLDVFMEELVFFIKSYSFLPYMFTVNNREGPHTNLRALILYTGTLESEQDYSRLLTRLSKLPKQMEELMIWIKRSVKLDICQHHFALDEMINHLKPYRTIGPENPIWAPFEVYPSSFTLGQSLTIKKKANKLFTNSILPSFEAYVELLSDIYIPTCRKEMSCSYIPNGESYYEQCLRFYTDCHLKPREIFDMAKKELENIEDEMSEVIASMYRKETPRKAAVILKQNSLFYCSNKEDYINCWKDVIENKILPNLHRYFPITSDYPVMFSTIATAENDCSPLVYEVIPYQKKNVVFITINTADFNKRPLFDLIPLALHEIFPGHCFRKIMLSKQKDFPDFLRYQDKRMNMVTHVFPSRMSLQEGWGLYSEGFGYDLDLYQDYYSRFAYLGSQMLQASKVMIDVGIHSFDWSYEKAYDFLKEHSILPVDLLKNEICKIAAQPGFHSCYKIGELRLKKIQLTAKNVLGSYFNQLLLHNILLKSPNSFSYMEANLKAHVLTQIPEIIQQES